MAFVSDTRRDLKLSLKSPKISIIIPVYNVEKYIEKALKSVLAQTFTDYEVIMVNDGSTDGSLSILRAYEKKYDNFHLIDLCHGGLSKARSAGVNAATGEYIAFLDSDDFLAPNFLEALYNTAVENDADISSCNFYLYYDKGRNKFLMPFTARSGVYSNEVALRKLILDTTFHFFMWNKLYKRELFTQNDIKFYDMYFEDITMAPQLFYYANKVAFVNKPLYYYSRRKDSIISTIDATKINDYIKAMGITRNFLEEKGVYEIYKTAFKTYAFRFKFHMGYCIFSNHLDKLSFTDIAANIKRAYCAINLFKSDYYMPENNPPVLPSYVQPPQQRKKVSIR